MSVLSLDEALAHLNMSSASSDADELYAIVEAAEAIISAQIGALSSTDATARVTGRAGLLLLPVGRVSSLTSVTPVGGTALDVDLLALDPVAGTVAFADGRTRFPARAYDVAYGTGWDDDVPADLLLAIKEMVRHLWKSQRGSAARPGSTDSAPPPGYLIPNSVAEILEPYMPLGFA